MRYQTRELGTVEIAKDKVLCFTAPLVGFEAFHKYALLPAPGAKPLFVLQSLQEPQLAFPVVRADELSLVCRGHGCAIPLSAADLRRVTATTPDEVTCWIVVALPADGSPLRLNLRAPVIVNERKQLAAQVILAEECSTAGRLGDSEIGRFPNHPVSQFPNLPVSQSPAAVACQGASV